MAVKFSELQVKITGESSELEKVFRSANADLAKISAESSRATAGFTKFGQTLTGVGSGLTAGLTLPLGALATAAVAAAEGFNRAQAKIRVGTGATGEALADLDKSFRSVFRGVPQSAAEVATAIADLNTRLGLTGTPLERTAKQMLDLSRITGEQLQPLIAGTTRVMGDWARSSEQVGGSLDFLFRVSQATGIGVTQLAQKVVQFGSPLRLMGFEFEQAAILMGKFEQEGVNAELVFGSLRQALGNFAREGITDTNAALLALMERIKAAGSAGEATALAMKTFGAEAGPDMAAAIREGRFEIAELQRVLGASGETITKAGDDAKTLADRFSELRNQAAEALEPLGRELVPILDDLIRNGLVPASEKARELARWFGELDPAAKKAGLGFAALLAVAGPTSIVLGQTLLAVNQLVLLLPTLAFFAKAAGAALSAIALPAAAVAASVGVLAQFRDSLQQWGNAADKARASAFSAQGAAFVAAAGIDAASTAARRGEDALQGVAAAADQVGASGKEAAAGLGVAGEAAETARVRFLGLQDALRQIEVRNEARQFVEGWVRGLDEARRGVERLIEPPNLDEFGRQALTAAQFLKVMADQVSDTAALAGALQFPGMGGALTSVGPAADYLEQWTRDQEKLGKDAGRRFAREYGQGMQEISTVFNDLERGLAKVIFRSASLGEVGKRVAQEFGEALTRMVLRGALTPIYDQLGNILGKLPMLSKFFGGVSSPGGAPGSSLTGAGGAAGSIAGGWVSAISGIATAVSSIFGNFQMAGMNRTLDIIAKHTLQTVMVGEASFYMTKERLEWINDRLVEFRQLGIGVYGQPGYDGLQFAGGAAAAGVTINWDGNMYGGPAGIGELTDAIVRELRRRGVRIG